MNAYGFRVSFTVRHATVGFTHDGMEFTLNPQCPDVLERWHDDDREWRGISLDWHPDSAEAAVLVELAVEATAAVGDEMVLLPPVEWSRLRASSPSVRRLVAVESMPLEWALQYGLSQAV